MTGIRVAGWPAIVLLLGAQLAASSSGQRARQAPTALPSLASPNAAGVAMGHLHYRVRDVDADARFWMSLGGRLISRGEDVVLAFQDVFVFVSPGAPEGGTEGSVINHVAFRVPVLSTVEAAGLTVARLARFPGVASVTSPDGERVELFENAARNLTFVPDAGPLDPVASRHNRPIEAPVVFHHVHLYVPAGQVPVAKAWYVRLFGGVPGKRSTYEAVDLPGINVNFGESANPVAPTRGRMLDHIGFDVRDLEAFCRRLGAMGVIFDVPFSRDRTGLGTARITDPWGTTIELTEGLEGRVGREEKSL